MMKKTLALLMGAVLVMSMVLAGCATTKAPAETADELQLDTLPPTETSAATPEPTPEAGQEYVPPAEDQSDGQQYVPSASGDANAYLQAIVDSAQSQISSLEKSFGETMKVSVTAEGNSIIYTFQYIIDLGTDAAKAKAALESGTDTLTGTFESLLSLLKSQNVEAPSVIVNYLDKDGAVLYSKTFS